MVESSKRIVVFLKKNLLCKVFILNSASYIGYILFKLMPRYNMPEILKFLEAIILTHTINMEKDAVIKVERNNRFNNFS